MQITDEIVAELESLAISVRGWNMTAFFQEPDAFEVEADWEWHVGAIDEDGNKYPLLHVNASQYDSDDSEKIARYYAACNRDTILALLTERAELKREVEQYRIAVAEVMRQVDGNIRETVRDCVNGHNDVQDIYDYCDQIEAAVNTVQGLK